MFPIRRFFRGGFDIAYIRARIGLRNREANPLLARQYLGEYLVLQSLAGEFQEGWRADDESDEYRRQPAGAD